MTDTALQLPRPYKAVVAAALILVAALIPGAAQSQTKIVAGMVAHGPPQWPQYIAMEFGWFKQDNIELELLGVGGGGAQQLAGGSLNIAHSGYPDFARASLRGAPLKIILASADGEAIRPLAARLGVSPNTVCIWRRRYLGQGMEGLRTRPRSGRRKEVTLSKEQAVVAATVKEPKDTTHWSTRQLGEKVGLSHVTVHRLAAEVVRKVQTPR